MTHFGVHLFDILNSQPLLVYFNLFCYTLFIIYLFYYYNLNFNNSLSVTYCISFFFFLKTVYVIRNASILYYVWPRIRNKWVSRLHRSAHFLWWNTLTYIGSKLIDRRRLMFFNWRNWLGMGYSLLKKNYLLLVWLY